MSFSLEFLPEAAAEVECVTGDYEARSVGLRSEVESVCGGIVQHPLLWRLRPAGYRRVNLPGFPYYVAFISDDHLALVIAVARSSRHPSFFKSRMP